MNREIKFRAWNEVNKYMHYENVFVSDGGVYIRYSDGALCGAFEIPQERFEKRNFILMQFTGLKDKNGVEIYEGDICKIINASNIGKIYFKQGKFLMNNWGFLDDSDKEIEVIGNIYENPELLK